MHHQIVFNGSTSLCRQSPLPVRRASNPYKDSKPANNRLSVAVRAQQRHSPRGANGDRSKASKAKEKKESKERKEAAGKAKEDKVNNTSAALGSPSRPIVSDSAVSIVDSTR